jgi:hypothetical protein
LIGEKHGFDLGRVLTGVYRRAGLEFRYTVVRVWQEPVETLLDGGPTTLPLAMLTDTAAADLPGVFDRVVDQLRRSDVPGKLADEVLGSTYVLCGLRYGPDQVAALYGSLSMLLEDSSTYQQILNKGVAQGVAQGVVQGAVEAAQRMLLIQGQMRFGHAPEETATALQRITDRPRLERIAGRIFDATGWDDLLATT